MFKPNITSVKAHRPCPAAGDHGLFDNGCALSVPHGRDMSHNRRTLQYVEHGFGLPRFGAPTHATERRPGVRKGAAFVPGSNAEMWLVAEYFAVCGEHSGRSARPILKTASLVGREGSEADGR
jgi:hypothetical protein